MNNRRSTDRWQPHQTFIDPEGGRTLPILHSCGRLQRLYISDASSSLSLRPKNAQ
jgi:hypothetical protein